MRRGRRVILLALACAVTAAVLGGVAWAAFTGKASNSGNSLAASSSFPRCYGDEVLADSPSKYWRLDESSGTTATESVGGANGTYMAGANPGQSGALAEAANKAASFDGTDDWVDIPDQSFAGDFTVEFWVYVTNPGTRGTNGNADAALGQEGTGADINFANSKARLWNGTTDVVAEDDAVRASTWEHYVITRSGTTVRLYRNGVENSTTGTWSGTFTLKAIGRGNGGFLLGRVDDVAMWSSALSATRVRAHYNAGRCVRDEPLADNPTAFWRLGEPVVAPVAFDSANTNNGKPTPSVTFNQASGLDGDTGKSADFDGTNSWITTPDLGSTVDFTLEGWTYLTDATWNSTQNFNEVMYGQSGKLRLIIRPSGWYAGPYPGNVEYQVQGSNGTNANINAWVHWAVVRNGATLKVYRNGLEVGSRSDLPATTTQTLGGQIGRDNSTYILKGKIDDVAVYTSALSASRVRAHYIAGRSYRDIVMEDGPAGYWRLGESSGTVAADEKGANAGSYNGGFTFGKPSRIAGDANNALGLNGSTGYVRVPDAASLDPTGAFSLECWTRPTTQGAAQTLFRKEGAYLFKWNGTTVIAARWNAGGIGSSFVNYTPSPAWSANTTYHMVLTYDGTNMKLYMNGALVNTVPMTGTVDTSARDLIIGAFENTSGALSEWLTGSLDEAAVYNKALSADQVALHYEAGIDAPR